jgi:hypothetical protein
MKQRSMLHQETLMLLDHFARGARHGVLEIGAYVGGGTAVMAKALEEALFPSFRSKPAANTIIHTCRVPTS